MNDPSRGLTRVHIFRRSGLAQGLLKFAEAFQDAEITASDYNLRRASFLGKGLPDLIALDFDRPHERDFQLCRQIKSHPITKHIPIVLLSSEFADDDEVKGFEVGADDVLRKPLSKKILQLRVLRILAAG